MLDTELLSQLRNLFADLPAEIVLALAPSTHEKQAELRGMLAEVASTSPKVRVEETGPEAEVLRFELLRNGEPTGVSFRAVPGGHEFSSLVLAILNAAGKGRLPDAETQRRIKALRGPIQLKTYLSLACTNCPDVVQSLNLMALLNPGIQHEAVDGALVEQELQLRGVQAVPTVVAGDDVIHVGRSSLGELLDKLEERYGSVAVAETAAPALPREYDVVVLGGGPAGVTAAIYSVRKGLRTAVVTDRVGGQVMDTLGIENLISVPYTEGPRLSADLAKHMAAYAIDVLEHRRVEALVDGPKKELRLKSGEVVRAPTVILALGAKWRELGVPGEKEHIGRGVAFCPHCDGPFYKGKRVAVIGGGNSGVEAAIDLAGICAHVTLVEFLDQLKADAVLVRNLRSLPNVDVITSARVTEVVGAGQGVGAIRYQDRKTEEAKEVAVDGVFVQIGLVPNSALVKGLVELNRFGEIVVDDRGRTSAPGIYAAGDVTTVPFKQIVIAMGDGAKAALAAFEDRMRAS